MTPPPTIGLRHLALTIVPLEACERFYTELLGMEVEWKPDPDNVYLTAGHDNLALHRAPAGFEPGESQRLDHLGFMLAKIEDVDSWYAFLQAADVPIIAKPKTHRDGARSLYCHDPAGNVVQIIYHPPLASLGGKR